MKFTFKDKYKKCLQKLRSGNVEEPYNFEFITESPKSGSLADPLGFGHEEIVDTLIQIVNKSPESFTIGLYGDWGSGKSTIAYTLRDKLESEKIPLVLFDVWKHEGDALRRTFLKETHKFFSTSKIWKNKYSGEDGLLENLNKSKKSFKRIPLSNWGYIKALFFLPISFVIFLLSTWIVLDKWLNLIDFKKSDLSGSILLFLSLIPVSFITRVILKYIEQVKGDKEEYYQEKIQDPIEFEELFKDIILNLSSDIKKVVFVFDNLDRVSGEKAIQIMSTIKTFLDPIDRSIISKNIVFLIPCDEMAIKRHLKKTLSYSQEFKGDVYRQYAGEYLRKFFNTILWIPDFYVSELEELATKKLKETEILDFQNIELAALIVLVFDKNPRQIIQFINILISNYLLFHKRSIKGFSINKDIAQLAKYLLLIQKFPDIMELYKNTMCYSLEETPPEIEEEVDSKRIFSEKRVADFRDFLSLTEHVRIESLDVFFKLRMSDFDIEFENSSRLIKLLETNRIKEILTLKEEDSSDKKSDLDYIERIDFENKSYQLSQIVNEKLRTSTNPVLIAKFIDGLLVLTKFKSITLEEESYKKIYHTLKRHRSHISTIEPENIISEIFNKVENAYTKPRLRKLIAKQQIEDVVNAHTKIN